MVADNEKNYEGKSEESQLLYLTDILFIFPQRMTVKANLGEILNSCSEEHEQTVTRHHIQCYKRICFILFPNSTWNLDGMVTVELAPTSKFDDSNFSKLTLRLNKERHIAYWSSRYFLNRLAGMLLITDFPIQSWPNVTNNNNNNHNLLSKLYIYHWLLICSKEVDNSLFSACLNGVKNWIDKTKVTFTSLRINRIN